jgi:transposase
MFNQSMLAASAIASSGEEAARLQGLLAEREEQIARRDQTIAELRAQLESLQQQILALRRAHFGAKSERLGGQADLFCETVSVPLAPPATERVSYERERRGRPALPKDLPRRRIEYDLSEAEKREFERVVRIGEELSETLDYTPAKLLVIEHARAKYVCETAGEQTIRVAAAEPSPLPKSNASAGLLAQVLVAKYADHIPLARQERIFARHGVPIARTTLCEWVLGSAQLLEVLIPRLSEHVLAAPRLHCDDTAVPLADAGRGKTKTARMWGYLGAGSRCDETGQWVDHPPGVVFEFTESREAAHPLRFLKDYSGYLQADAYAGFDCLYHTGRVIEVGCWAHARRKLFEVAQASKTPGLAHQGLAFIAKLYEIEARVKHQSPDDKLAARQAESVLVLTDFKAWLDAHYRTLLPKGPLAQAFHYALANWQALTRYTENGVLEPDNNRLERALRPIAMGRRAWLFAGSARGGRAAATLFSLIETAKLNQVEPFAYLRDVLRRLPSHPLSQVTELLPFHWRPAASS